MAIRPLMARRLWAKVVGITAFAAVAVATPASLGGQDIPTGEPIAAETLSETGLIETLSEWERFVYDRTARMTVPVSINGATAVPFIIDTGAERTVISRELAASLNLPPSRSMRLATIAGLVVTDSYRIQHLANGGFAVSDFDAPALERRHMGIDGLIGIESLEDKVIVFDFAGQKMQVLQSGQAVRRASADDDEIIVRAKRKKGRMILSGAQMFGRRIDLIIDTGAQSSIGNLALQRLARTRGRMDDGVTAHITDVSGIIVAGEVSTIPEITIANFKLSNLPIAFTDNYALEQLGLSDRPAMLLGMDALSIFDRVEIDFGLRTVKFVVPSSKTGGSLRRSLSHHGESKI